MQKEKGAADAAPFLCAVRDTELQISRGACPRGSASDRRARDDSFSRTYLSLGVPPLATVFLLVFDFSGDLAAPFPTTND
jgi:hypothetical protein